MDFKRIGEGENIKLQGNEYFLYYMYSKLEKI
jgi:hypothetical protein